MSKHAAIWIDHKEAHVLLLRPDDVKEAIIRAHPDHIHHKHHEKDANASEKRFFQEVAEQLRSSEAILIVGPSTAKLDFLRYLHKHNPNLETKIVAIETVDHPTDAQLIAFVRKYFSDHGDAAAKSSALPAPS